MGFVLGQREGGREGEEEEEEEERVFLAVARALRAVASFGVVGKDASTSPSLPPSLPSNPPLSPSGFFLAKVEAGREGGEESPIYFPVSSSFSLTDEKAVKQWVQKNNHPLLSPLQGHNFRRLGSLGKVGREGGREGSQAVDAEE